MGWDDNKPTQADQPGAWLCRNSWGDTWNGDGHFWISYYDKHTAKHPEMGGVTFSGVEPCRFDNIYSHSLHGWQYDTGSDTNITAAANRFVAQQTEHLKSVGFYTLADNVNYTISIYKDNLSSSAVSQTSGTIAGPGFHMVDLAGAVSLNAGNVFFVTVEVYKGGYAFDASFRLYVVMGPIAQPPEDIYYTEDITEGFYKFDMSARHTVGGTITDPPYDIYSSAAANESFYRNTLGQWLDFIHYDAYGSFNTEWNDSSWNFAITGYAARPGPGDINNDGSVDYGDFAILAEQWQQPPGTPSADIAPAPDGDGIVDGFDLSFFAEYWLKNTP